MGDMFGIAVEEEKAVTLPVKNDVREMIKARQADFASVLPKHCSPERFVRLAVNAVLRNRKLLECTPNSVMQCMLDLSRFGLEPDGRHAHLIPFNKKQQDNSYRMECTLIVDYKGLVEIVRRSGKIDTIHCDVIYADDEFDLAYGTGGACRHKPNWKGSRTADDIIGAYSYVRFKDGSDDYLAMTKTEIEVIKEGAKKKNGGRESQVWRDFYAEMAKKTVFRRHAKWLPFAVEQVNAYDSKEGREIVTVGDVFDVEDLSEEDGRVMEVEAPKAKPSLRRDLDSAENLGGDR